MSSTRTAWKWNRAGDAYGTKARGRGATSALDFGGSAGGIAKAGATTAMAAVPPSAFSAVLRSMSRESGGLGRSGLG